MADLGARAYRFSVSWSRVLPTGTGAVNQPGLDFYQRLVDALLAAGVQPLINLFHWDLPQALQDHGGFANPEVVGWFTDYAALLASNLGDRVKDWMTFNEPAVLCLPRPCRRDPRAGPARLADGDPGRRQPAARSCRRRRRRSVLTSTTRRSASRSTSTRSRRRPTPSAIESPPTQWSSARDAWFLDPLFGRGYPKLGLEAHREAGHLDGVDLAEPPAGDLDYLGLNYYRRDSVSARSDRVFDWEIGAVRDSEQTQMGWHVAPDGLRDVALSNSTRRTRPREIVITENGAAYPDTVDRDGRVRDDRRVEYLARHVAAAAEALAAGVPLTGYHVWSLLDNYEWSLGYTRRFGLIHVDFESQRRTLKDSAIWYGRLIAAAG